MWSQGKRMGESVANARELIGDILSSQRVAQSRVLSSRVYDDEPLLFTGSQMRSFLPARYREMRQLGTTEYSNGTYRRPSQTELFVQQAKFMEDWEDDFPYKGSFKRYFPTYSMMNDQQLRGYFTWRTKVRAGCIEESSLSFAYIYVYELLNGIGAESPQDSFDKLYAFWQDSRKIFCGLDSYVPTWLRDLVIFHDLPSGLFDRFVDLSFEKALIALKLYEQSSIQGGAAAIASCNIGDLWASLCTLSDYGSKESPFLAQNSEKCAEIAAEVISRLSVHYSRKRKKGLTETWFGAPQVSEHCMFPSAVFEGSQSHEDCRYDVNDVHSYICKDGRWYALRRYKNPAPNGALGLIMRAIEHSLRGGDAAGFASMTLNLPKYQLSIVEEATEQARLRVARAAKTRVDINRASLGAIRRAAAGTRERLLTEEERFGELDGPDISDPPVEDGGQQIDPPGNSTTSLTNTLDDTASSQASCPIDAGSGPYDLSDEELMLLRSLVEGNRLDLPNGDLLADSINEKLFNLLGDTALEFGGDGLQVVEEYLSDLEKVVGVCLSK